MSLTSAKRTVLIASGSLMLALSACGTPASPGTGNSPSSPSQPNAQQGADSRVQNQKLGVSYVLPKGFKEGTGGPDIPDLLVTTFVLGKPDPSKIVTQFMLTKLHGPHDYPRNTSPDMDNAALLNAFVENQYDAPGYKPEGEPERSEWQGTLPGVSALVRTKNPITGEHAGEYEAFIGSGDTRWSVRGFITTLPPGASIESVKGQFDEFAKAIRPL